MQTKLFGEIDEHVFVPFMKATSDKAEMCKTDSSFVQMYELSFSQSISFRMIRKLKFLTLISSIPDSFIEIGCEA